MIGLATMTQNQGNLLEEWILYHYKQGIEQYIIFLDKCTDNSQQVLEFIKNKYDIQIDYYTTESCKCIPNLMELHWINRSHAVYDFVLKQYSYLEWIAFIEVDEFVIPQEKNLLLGDFLKGLASKCLYINSWDFKGPFDFTKKILGQCYLNWTDEHRFNNGYRWRGKSIIKPNEFVKCIDAHHFKMKNGNVSTEFKNNRELIQIHHGLEVYIDDYKFRIGHFRNHTPLTTIDNYINVEKYIKKNVAIIGGGWYGCYIAEYLLDNFNHLNITIIERDDDIFKGSSYNNQNRLHLGFHYPRCSITNRKCITNFHLFSEKYPELLENIEHNFYAIAEGSKIQFNDFKNLYEDFTIMENDFLKNIEGGIINTNEKYINFKKAQGYFKTKLLNKAKLLTNYNVINVKNINGVVNINNSLVFDKVFNCTYNQLEVDEQPSNHAIYEKSLTLIYKKISKIPFDCLTIMDGNYNSIFKYDDNDTYTLTSVKYTPLIIDSTFSKVQKFSDYDIHDKIRLFEEEILRFYPDFNKNFIYNGFYESFKCKNVNLNDSRDINVHIDKNIFSVWCGKISFIFELDSLINKFIY